MADDYFKNTLEEIDSNILLGYQNIVIQVLKKKSSNIAFFESTETLEIDEELYLT